jgi:energy-converting hydrogenase Eha subunit H
MLPEKDQLQTFRKYLVEISVIALVAAVIFLFKNYVSYLAKDRETMIQVIDNNTSTTKENAFLIKEFLIEVKEMAKEVKK